MLRGVLALFLANPPTITVDVSALALPHAQSEQLHGELMTRLVEDGHAVGSAGAITVRVSGGGTLVHVEVQHGRAAKVRDVTGEGALLRLATIHAAIELLAQVEAITIDPDPVLAAPRERSVALEVTPGSEARAPEVVMAIVDSGHVVTPSVEGALLKVCVAEVAGEMTLAVVATGERCPPGETTADVTTAVATALAKARADEPSDAIARDDAARPRSSTRATAPVVSPRPSATTARAWSGALGIGLGVEGRLQPVEPLVMVRGDARHRTGALITTRVEIAPSRVGALTLTDTFITAGGGWRFAVHPRIRIELALTGGIAVHGYALENDRGARVDFTAELPLAIGVLLGKRVELGLAPLAGVSTRTRRHYRGDELVWARDRWRFAGLLSVSIVLDGKPSRKK